VIVFTNGVFDILHRGHVHCLQEAAKHGRLFVGVNSDASAERIKRRPINDEDSRLAVVQSLACVHHAMLFNEDTPAKLIRAMEPKLYVKGGDYSVAELARFGVEVLVIPRLAGYSTTDIIARIREGSIPR
jgi:rfaE bifunctional protein nucleotidyltransferase chain/domain